MLVFRNKNNKSRYSYFTLSNKEAHKQKMDNMGFEPCYEWEEINEKGRTIYFCEYREFGKA